MKKKTKAATSCTAECPHRKGGECLCGAVKNRRAFEAKKAAPPSLLEAAKQALANLEWMNREKPAAGIMEQSAIRTNLRAAIAVHENAPKAFPAHCPKCGKPLDGFGCCAKCGYEDPQGGPESI